MNKFLVDDWDSVFKQRALSGGFNRASPTRVRTTRNRVWSLDMIPAHTPPRS